MAAERFGPVFEPDQPGPVTEVRAAPPVVADAHMQNLVTFGHVDIGGGGMGVLGSVGQCLGHGVLGGGLDRLGEPPVDLDVEMDGDGGSAGQRPDCRGQAALGQDGRVQPAGDLSQFV